MKLRASLLIATSLVATGCTKQQLDTIPDAQAFLSSQGGPQIDGVTATLLKAAQDAEGSGDYTTAGNYYQQLVDKDPNNMSYSIALAENTRRRGDVDRAIGMYDQILTRDSTNLQAREGRGLALVSRGDFEVAEQNFLPLLQNGTATWRSYNAMGIISAGKQKPAEAEQYFLQAQSMSPNNPTVLNNAGLAQAISHNFDASVVTLTQASAIAAPRPNFRRQIDLNTAMVYAAAGKLDNAESIARQYFEGPTLSNNMGFYAHLANDDQLAKTYLNMALTQSKRFYTRAWDNLQNLNAKQNAATTPAPLMDAPEPVASLQPAPAPAAASAPVALAPAPASQAYAAPAAAALAPAAGAAPVQAVSAVTPPPPSMGYLKLPGNAQQQAKIAIAPPAPPVAYAPAPVQPQYQQPMAPAPVQQAYQPQPQYQQQYQQPQYQQPAMAAAPNATSYGTMAPAAGQPAMPASAAYPYPAATTGVRAPAAQPVIPGAAQPVRRSKSTMESVGDWFGDMLDY